MYRVSEEIYSWSLFSEEKQLDFNGLYLKTALGPVLIDPPPLGPEDIEEVEALGVPGKIYLTNKHHTRASRDHRERWRCQLFVHEDDRSLMEIPVDGTFADGEILNDTLEVIRILNFKTPGECAFFWKERGVLIVGDAVLGKPPGSLSFLPDKKFRDPKAARQGLLALRGLEFDKLLLGDGKAILENARPVLENFIRSVLDS